MEDLFDPKRTHKQLLLPKNPKRVQIFKKNRYRRLWWYVVIMVSIISFTPLITLTLVNHNQYEEAITEEVKIRVEHMTDSTQRSLEFFINERTAALKFIAEDIATAWSYEELTGNEAVNADSNYEVLAPIYNNLKDSFGGIVDLGVIDNDGKMRTYAGDNETIREKLESEGYVDYENDLWFSKLKTKKEGESSVSSVFEGKRGTLHFVIAVPHKAGSSTFYLRATIDSDILMKEIRSLKISSPSEAFIINEEGILQTPSINYGSITKRAEIVIPNYSEASLVTEKKGEDGHIYIQGSAYIDNSPFILVMIKHPDDIMANWFELRKDLGIFLIICIIVILVVLIFGAYYLVQRVQVADAQRAQVLHKAEYTNKMASIGRLAAGVAHEINNPLAIINEKAGMVKDMATFSDKPLEKERVMQLIKSILNSVERCSKITQRLLGFAKHIDVYVDTIDLNQLISEVLDFLEQEARYNNIFIKVNKSPDLPTLSSDRSQIQQVFLNIINNALNALSAVDKEDKNVEISMRQEDDSNVSIEITDNGPGISKENLKKIFDPFFTTRATGTGLGLSITYGIVQKLGGQINVESTLGEGTSFVVTLPITKSA